MDTAFMILDGTAGAGKHSFRRMSHHAPFLFFCVSIKIL